MNNERAQTLVSKIEGIVGQDHVIVDDALRDFYSTDIREKRETTLAIVQPDSVETLQAIVTDCAAEGVAVVPRGGGMSYSGGYTVNEPRSITIDMSRLDKIVDLNLTNGTVTVEAGVTWAALDAELKKHRLRTPFYGPFSGAHATIGGSLAQNSLSLGSACFGISADSVINLDVVTGEGALISTGSKAATGGHNFFRYFGPDLTGIFLGDCGAMGIKARITLRLIPRYKYRSAASFSFETFDDIAKGMSAVARLGVADCSFGNDPASLQQMMNAQGSEPDAMKQVARNILNEAPNKAIGAWRLARMGLAGQSFLKKVKYNYHVIVDGHSFAEVRRKLKLARQAARPFGREIPNTIPTVISSSPFVSIPPPRPERLRRGVPQHGVVPFDRTVDLYNGLQSLYRRNEKEM